MTVDDALSREYLPEADPEMETLENVHMFNMLDVTPDRYFDIAHRARLELADLCSIIVHGWPDINLKHLFALENTGILEICYQSQMA